MSSTEMGGHSILVLNQETQPGHPAQIVQIPWICDLAIDTE